MTQQRPIDVSTGKPVGIRDYEIHAELRERFAEKIEQREGEVMRIYIEHDGLTAPRGVLRRGEIVEIEVGSDEWLMTLDTETGESWLDRDEAQQRERWGRVMFRPCHEDDVEPSDPYQDDRPNRPPMRKPRNDAASAWANLKRVYGEEAELAGQPLRTTSRTHRAPQEGSQGR